ncbi:TetR/AcrR family transcriptional regulator [Pollutimonas harenae]|uniref:TetR/AcrR family transcriptional regulator n=1 Tax=Pollutimonas harenae TaxID=657015 RepID=A0A853GRA6_9BURK|nr:TetR/AcrR family transcriptional regulator [Pollutimonas harenae]NYT84691.1 TetR/AcrR family transcriptional regulator [Pollutimonas harenae]TEA72906.1 TetR/AcrR family transcriptional regulator [Pollutimonas harenae]
MSTELTPQQEILQLAAECFMEQGFNATSIDDVARRMHATKGRIYHYYASKTDLFFEIHREGMSRLFAAVLPAQRTAGNGITVLAAMLHAHALALFEHHAFESVVVQGVQLHRYGALTPGQRKVLDELIASRDRFEQLFKDQTHLAKADGSVGDLNTSIAVKTMLGGLQWALIWYRPEKDGSIENRRYLADQMVSTLVHGLQSRNPGSTPIHLKAKNQS